MGKHKSTKPKVRVYFSDFFNVAPQQIEDYGAFNISLVNDLPLFIDPFLLFNSPKIEYQKLHDEIIEYLRFIRSAAMKKQITPGLLQGWFQFPEVSQTWLGYSGVGNRGRGLGRNFATALYTNLHSIFTNFGSEDVTKASHLEKLCLVKEGVGKDNISDFTTNLIKGYLLTYTQDFAEQCIAADLLKKFRVDKVRFNYKTETWERAEFTLPFYNNNYVPLTPKDLLTREDTWINKNDLRDPDVFFQIAISIPNSQLREEINNYYRKFLDTPFGQTPSKEERQRAVVETISKYPEIIDYYIRYKEDKGDKATAISEERVTEAETLFIDKIQATVNTLFAETNFYDLLRNTYTETHQRIAYLKDVIENKGGHKLFYVEGKAIRKESDLHIMFRLVWSATVSVVTREANDGRGPVDFNISRGVSDKTLVEFKLASNPQLKRNLERQTQIYEKAANTDHSVKVIAYCSVEEEQKVERILKELGLLGDKDIVLIDARKDNKPSGSKA